MSLEVQPAVEKGIDMQMVKDVIAWIGTAIGIGLNITPASDLGDAAKKAVASIKQ